MTILDIPSNPITRSFQNGFFLSFDGRDRIILGGNNRGKPETRAYSVKPGQRVMIERLTLKVMTPPRSDLDRVAWEHGLYKSRKLSGFPAMREKVLSKTFFDPRWKVMRPTAKIKQGEKCALAICQVPGLDRGEIMWWYAEPDCDPAQLLKLLDK